MARIIGLKVWVDWDFNGSFTEETANLVSASGQLRFAPPEEAITGTQGIIDSANVELRNVSGRYSPLNTSGALYSYIQSGKAYHAPIYFEATIDGSTYTRIFTGVAKIPQETGRAHDGTPTVRITCHGRDELLLQKRMSTTQAGMVTRYEDGYTEAQIISAYLAAAGATPTSVDTGLVTIPWSWMDDESPLEDIWQLAAACGGRFYAAVDGTYTYENMAHWLNSPHLTSQQTYTAADWTRFEAWYEDGEIYDTITVEYSSRQPENTTVLWEPDEIVQVPANSVKTVWANYSYPAYSIAALTYKAGTVGGKDITSDVSISATYYAQRAKLVVTNANTTFAATLWPFQISGRPAMGGPSAEAVRTSADHGSNSAFFTDRGSRTRRVAGNLYIQTRAQAGTLAQFLLDRHENPRLYYRLSDTPGIPARKPGDRITVNDTSVMSSARDAMIIGVDWRYSGMVYTQTIEAIDAASLYPTGPYFIVGTNTLGTASSTPGKTFY